MKVQYKLQITPVGYSMSAEIIDDNEKTIETITKDVPFMEYDKLVRYSQEDLELKAKVEEIVKTKLFQTATDILKEDVDKCLEKLNGVIHGEIIQYN